MTKFLLTTLLVLASIGANAKTVGILDMPNFGRHMFTDEACPEMGAIARRFTVIDEKAALITKGCYAVYQGMVFLVAEKFGQGQIPADSVTWF